MFIFPLPLPGGLSPAVPAIDASGAPPSLPKILLRRALSTVPDECSVCMEASIDTVLVHGDNGHMCVCHTCSRMLTICPICRKPIEKAVFVFKQ